jgi:hypothetical protein
MNKTLRIGIDHYALEVLNFEFLFSFEILLMVIWGLPKDGSYGERIFILKQNFGVMIDVGIL